jgi:hypothetical protein
MCFPLFGIANTVCFTAIFFGLFALDDEMFHQWMLCAVLQISIAALIMGYLHYISFELFEVGSIGLALIIISTTLNHDV